MASVYLKKTSVLRGEVELPSSKSISNRLLVIDAFTGNRCPLKNLSEARDTQLLRRALMSSELTADVEHAGTAMRFLTAYYAVSNVEKIVTGSPRMKERPIGLLVTALRKLGFYIDYLEKEGYPPVYILPNETFIQKNNVIKISAHESSQYISALLLTAPMLPKGLELTIEGVPVSKPYTDMTVTLMREAGISVAVKGNTYRVPAGLYAAKNWEVESDWSAASYFYGMAALAKEANIFLKGLRENSLQGDRVIGEIMQRFGVTTRFEAAGVRIVKTSLSVPEYLEYDFSSCPDLAQTVAFVCAALGTTLKMRSISTLRLKETDRVAALQTELNKLGCVLKEPDDNDLLLQKAPVSEEENLSPHFRTYEDHRMAMAAAMLGVRRNVRIQAPEVVKKSFPGFWEQLHWLGMTIKKGE